MNIVSLPVISQYVSFTLVLSRFSTHSSQVPSHSAAPTTPSEVSGFSNFFVGMPDQALSIW